MQVAPTTLLVTDSVKTGLICSQPYLSDVLTCIYSQNVFLPHAAPDLEPQAVTLTITLDLDSVKIN